MNRDARAPRLSPCGIYISIIPALLYRLPNALCVLSSIILVQVGCLDVRGRARVWVVEQTASFPLALHPEHRRFSALPLDACQDCRNIVGWTPAVLEDIQAQLACSIDVGMEHLTNKLDSWWLVRVLLLKVHD